MMDPHFLTDVVCHGAPLLAGCLVAINHEQFARHQGEVIHNDLQIQAHLIDILLSEVKWQNQMRGRTPQLSWAWSSCTVKT